MQRTPIAISTAQNNAQPISIRPSDTDKSENKEPRPTSSIARGRGESGELKEPTRPAQRKSEKSAGIRPPLPQNIRWSPRGDHCCSNPIAKIVESDGLKASSNYTSWEQTLPTDDVAPHRWSSRTPQKKNKLRIQATIPLLDKPEVQEMSAIFSGSLVVDSTPVLHYGHRCERTWLQKEFAELEENRMRRGKEKTNTEDNYENNEIENAIGDPGS